MQTRQSKAKHAQAQSHTHTQRDTRIHSHALVRGCASLLHHTHCRRNSVASRRRRFVSFNLLSTCSSSTGGGGVATTLSLVALLRSLAQLRALSTLRASAERICQLWRRIASLLQQCDSAVIILFDHKSHLAFLESSQQ